MKKIKIFLASSNELKRDREQFEIQIYRKCKLWFDKNIFIHLEIWEDLSSIMTKNGIQKDLYNKLIEKEIDIFVLLAHTKVGKYTEKEFEAAFGSFKSKKKPFILTYFKDSKTTEQSLNDFKIKLKSLKHYYENYSTLDNLWNKFNTELDRLLLHNFKEFIFEKKDKETRKITLGKKSIYIENADNLNINM